MNYSKSAESIIYSIFRIIRTSTLLGCILVFFAFNLWSANENPDSLSTFVFEEEITGSIHLSSKVSVFPITADQSVSENEISSIPDSLFYTFDQLQEIPEHDRAWIRLKIHNKTSSKFQGTIFVCQDIDSLKVYLKYSDALTYLTTTGSAIKPSEKFYPSASNDFTLFLESDQKIEIYALVKLGKNSGVEHYFHFNMRDNFISRIRDDLYRRVFWAIALGFLLVFPVLSLIMYLNFKKNYFIYYSVLVVFMTFYFLNLQGITSMYITFPIAIRHYFITVIPIGGMVISAFLFFNSYLDIKRRVPLYFKFLLTITVISATLTITQSWIFNNMALGTDISNLGVIVFMLSLIGILIYLNFKRVKEARILLIATSLILVGGVLFTLTLLRIIPRNVIFSNGFQWGAIAFSGTLLYGLFDNIKQIQSERFKLKVEKEKTDELLFNILPYEVAMELKEKGVYEARDFDNVSVLFSDFKNFTLKSAQITAKELVDEINICFIEFDRIMEKYGIEKIKTIGDSYMAAAGLSPMSEKRAEVVVWAAIEMQEFLVHRNQESKEVGKETFEMRVGIHSGPVIAGIVGIKKFQYDIWGDTVNTASRVEAHGQEEKVNISESTYQEIKDHPDFIFEEREPIEVRGKGWFKMYFVSRRQ